MTAARRRALAAAATVAAGLTLILATGCGGGEDAGDGPPPLAWTAPPQVFATKALPDDRVAVGSVRNTTDRPVELNATALRVVDADGKRLRSAGQYAAGFAHGLYGAFQKPDPIPPGELRRLGLLITVAPGQTAPIAISWSLPRGSDKRRPAAVDYGKGRLVLPTAVKAGIG
ncbi:hypothetical protein DSM112329_02470 [Paraconexibacter sp. AEG42_29]|uniref:Uncharacterized protein n=1 Tax=Paraconexibacter sp. AEG42_29 TaxID=2997339 RepID=A0AAU7AV92_9ACTN